jgi:hypothetical protein
MKILILVEFDIKHEKITLENINKLYQIYAYSIIKYFNKYKDVELILNNLPNSRQKKFEDIDYPNVDHVLVLDNRGIYSRISSFYDILREKVQGAICTMCDNHKILGKENILFYMTPWGKRNKRRTKYLGWCADHEICRPDKYKNKLQIMVDHSYYGKWEKMNSFDKSLEIIKDVCNFAKEFKKNPNKYKISGKDTFDENEPIIIKRFISNSIETVDINNPYFEKYNRQGVSYSQACNEYNKSDIFIVTHLESLGVSVIENNMAGTLPVIPKGYIKDCLLSSITSVIYESDTIPWEEVIANVDCNKIRNKALKHTWEKKVEIIHDTLINYDPENTLYKNRYK